jgi:hypothetical protein
VIAALRGDGPETSYDAEEGGYWSVKVVATWLSPGKRPHTASVTESCSPLTESYTDDVVVRERHLRGRAVDALNEQLREFILDAAAVREYLERPVFMVTSSEGMESIHTDQPSAERYAATLCSELGAGGVKVTPVNPTGRIRDLLTEIVMEPKP